MDHILFVLGLFLLSMRAIPLLWQITAFTVAHSLTLALGGLGVITVPAGIVEPLIAASLVLVGLENIFFRHRTVWRPIVVFALGLLHGLGFAAALNTETLIAGQIAYALAGFNLGVELGQLAVITLAAAVLWASVAAARRAQLPAEAAALARAPVMFRAVSISGSLVIALIGVWWTVQRVLF